MPYFITDDAEGCSGWATIKEDGEVIGCHMTKQDAIDQMVAVSIAEDIQVGGERKKKKKPMQYRALPENYRSALEDDVPEGRSCGNCLFFNEAKQITEDGLRKAYCERWEDYAQGGFYCNAWQPKKGELRAPAPASDQIEGSDENKPGSAQGAGGDIDFDEKTETALRNKVSDHNDQMAEQEKPTWTRTTLGQLKAVYRRGSGAYSTSHRPGVSRAAWSMARVNAYLYLLRNGRPENPAYTTDFDLLPEGHPKSTRNFTFLQIEDRQVDLSVPEYIQENAAQGLRWHREGLSGQGLVERTVREAAAMARGDITEDKVRRMSAWFARHMSDLSAPSAKPDHPDYPSPGVVAHALWGGGTRDQSERAMAWAEAKVKALDSEERNAMTATMSAAVTSNVETRDLPMTMANFEFRDNSDFMSFRGYAAVFNSESEPLPFRETILPGAFSRSLRSRNNVKMFVNHNMDQVLASSRAGTLKLSEDNRGLLVEADLPPTTYAKDLSIMMRRGDVDSMSFGFSVPRNGDSWNDDQSQRTLKEVRLHEVSIVTSFPAYAATTAQVRTIDILAKRAGCEVDSIADAIRSIESGSELTREQREVIAGLVDALTLKSAPAEQPSQKLNLLRAKLEHAYKAI